MRKIRQTVRWPVGIVGAMANGAGRSLRDEVCVKVIDMTARLALGLLLGFLTVSCAVPGVARAAGNGGPRLVAIVTEVAGPARIVVGGRTLDPDVADSVQEGSIVALERDARIDLTYPADGSVYELRGPGRFVVRRSAVESRSRSGQLTRRDLAPALRALRIHAEGSALQGSAVMRGASAPELQADGPSGSQLAHDQLRLCWRSLGPQWTYRVRLIDDDGVVLFEGHTGDSEFQFSGATELQPGAPYLWHVLATGPNSQSVEAAGQFRQLDPESEQALLRAESSVSESDATGRTLIQIARHQFGLAPGGASACDRDRPGAAFSASSSTSPE